MKKILLYFLAASIALPSCIADNGNDRYGRINEAAIEFDSETYSVIALEDNLTITPEITFSEGSDAGFEYVWTIHKEYGTYSDVAAVQVDTIARTRNLDWNVALGSGRYILYYKVGNTATGVSYYHRATVDVVTRYSRGFYVLKETDGNSDLDLFIPGADGVTAIPDVIASLHGEPVAGRPTGFGIVYQHGFMTAEGTYDQTRTLNIATDRKDIRTYNTLDMNLIYDHNTMFYRDDIPDETPHYVCAQYFGICYISDRGLYFSYQVPGWGMMGGGKFGYPDVASGSLKPNRNIAILGGTVPDVVLFDEAGGRLVSYDANGMGTLFSDLGPNGAVAPALPRGIGHRLIYNGSNYMSNTRRGFMVFEDRDDPSRRYFYSLQYSRYTNPIREVRPLEGSLMNSATMYAANECTAIVTYFVHGNRVYMYDVGSGDETPLTLTGLGAGETITCISNRWYTLERDHAFNCLVVGTSTGSGYKVYLYDISGGAVPAGAPQRIFEGGGRAFSLHYVSEGMNTDSVHGAYSFGCY